MKSVREMEFCVFGSLYIRVNKFDSRIYLVLFYFFLIKYIVKVFISCFDEVICIFFFIIYRKLFLKESDFGVYCVC